MPVLRRLDLRAAPPEESGDPPYYDLGTQSVTAANFTVKWAATGVAKVDVT